MINAQDDNGKTPLHLAMGRNHLQTIQMLIHFKANPNLTDNSGKKAEDCLSKTSVAMTVKNMITALKIPVTPHFIFQQPMPAERFSVINNVQFVTHHKNQQLQKITKLNQHEIM